MDYDNLNLAAKKYDFLNDPVIVKFHKLAQAQKESEQRQEFERATPSKEVLEELVKRGEALGTPDYKQDGTMTFDFFLATIKVAVEFTGRHTNKHLKDCEASRRAALKANNTEAYQTEILKAANFEQLTSRLIEANLYQSLKVPKQVFEKSMSVYMMEPAKRTIIEEEIQVLRDSFRLRTKVELTREQTLDAVKRLEIAKYEAQKKMYEIVRTQKLQPAMINALIKVEKVRADDTFFNDTGFEEEDVEPSVQRLDLTKDPEYTAIIEEY